MRRYALCILTLSAALTALNGAAAAQNFHYLAGQQYCESVMAKRYDQCKSLNSDKEKACDERGSCEPTEHEAQIKEYQNAIAELNAGAIAEAERPRLQKTIDDLKEELDARKASAKDIESIAKECIYRRQAVYDFFANDVIKDTDSARRDAKALREKLLDELDDTEVLREAAKDRRDALEGASAETDRDKYDELVKMREEYEKQSAAYRDLEKKLADFKETYGDDIDSSADKLIAYYNEQQKGHQQAIDGQKERADKCGRLVYMSY